MDVYCDYWYIILGFVGEMLIVVEQYGWSFEVICGDFVELFSGQVLCLEYWCLVFFCLIGLGLEDVVLVNVFYCLCQVG